MGIRLLIVEDQRPLRRLLELSFPAPEFDVRLAEDGVVALQQARERVPDVMVLDIMLPRLSGLDVLRELRRDERFAGTRVIVLSARTQVSDREAAKAAGADHLMSKPFLIPELRETVRRFASDDALA